jgi:hypothetical protein
MASVSESLRKRQVFGRNRGPELAFRPDGRVAAHELAPASGLDYKPGTTKLALAFDPQNPDDIIDYYVAKFSELVKKCASVGPSETKQETPLL